MTVGAVVAEQVHLLEPQAELFAQPMGRHEGVGIGACDPRRRQLCASSERIIECGSGPVCASGADVASSTTDDEQRAVALPVEASAEQVFGLVRAVVEDDDARAGHGPR
jgi:hypothetical protein